jgi:hypothetical protein
LKISKIKKADNKKLSALRVGFYGLEKLPNKLLAPPHIQQPGTKQSRLIPNDLVKKPALRLDQQ